MFNFFNSLQGCFGSNSGCGWKQLEPLVTAILKNLILIGMFVAVSMVSYAGFVLLKGFGDASARSKARHIFMSVIVGLIILFGAYFIVDTILTKLLVDKGTGTIIRQIGL
jgi:Type IV secretion system pilin